MFFPVLISFTYICYIFLRTRNFQIHVKKIFLLTFFLIVVKILLASFNLFLFCLSEENQIKTLTIKQSKFKVHIEATKQSQIISCPLFFLAFSSHSLYLYIYICSQTCVQRPLLGPKIVAVVDRWLLFRGHLYNKS